MARLPRNLYRRGGSYYLRIVVRGKRHRISLGDDLTEARRLREIHLQRLKGEPADVGLTLTISDTASAITRYLEKVAPLTQCARAQASSTTRLRAYLLPALCGLELRALTAEHLADVRRYAESCGLAPATVADTMSTVRTFLNWCVSVQLLERSPWRRGLMPRLQQRAPDRLTDDLVTAILAAARGEGLFAVEFSLLTGLRRGELVNLHRRHVHERPRPHLLLEVTKSGRVRRVPLSPRAWAILEAHLKTHTAVHVLANRTLNAQPAVRRIGAEFHWHWHQLRHTFACRYLEAGGRLVALQHILGHSTVKVTERYAMLSDDAIFEDLARVSASEFQAPEATPEATALDGGVTEARK